MDYSISFLESLLLLDKKSQKLILKKYIKNIYDFKRVGGGLHQLDERCPNRNLWSFYVNEDIRIILFKENSEFIGVYTGHHDNAYKWANNKDANWTPLDEVDIYKNSPFNNETTLVKNKNIVEVPYGESLVRENSVINGQEIFKEQLIKLGLTNEHLQEILNITDTDQFLNYISQFDVVKQEILLRLACGEKFDFANISDIEDIVKLEDGGNIESFPAKGIENTGSQNEIFQLIKYKLLEIEETLNMQQELFTKNQRSIEVENFIVVFEDDILDSVVRRKIKKYEGPIYYSDIKTIKKISYDGVNGRIKDLEGIQYIKHLEELYLINNEIFSLEPLRELTKLKRLYLPYNGIWDIAPIKNLVNIEILDLSNNRINNIDALDNMEKLGSLKISENSVENLTPLRKAVNLIQLFAHHNKISNIGVLEYLENLTELYLGFNRVSNIDSLNKLGKIQKQRFKNDILGICDLNLEGNLIEDVDFISDFHWLMFLELLGNPIKDFSPIEEYNDKLLSGSTDLPFLFIDYEFRKLLQEKLGDEFIYPQDLIKITELDANDRNITSIEGIQFMTNLKDLRLRNNSIKDIKRLKHLKKLEKLDLVSNNITDISSLRNLDNLRQLGIAKNKIEDAEPLENLKNLQLLYLRENNIYNIDVLKDIYSNIQKKDFDLGNNI